MTTSLKTYTLQSNLYAAQRDIKELTEGLHAATERIDALERRCAQLELKTRDRRFGPQ